MNERNNPQRPRGNNTNYRIDLDEMYYRNQQRQRKRLQEEEVPRPRKPAPAPRKRKHVSIMKIILMTILLVILLATGALSAGVAWYVVKLSEDLPSMVELANPRNSLPSIMYDRNGEVIARLFIENRTPLELHEMSPNIIRAVLAAEDSAFYQHGGIRIGSIMRALWTDVVEGGKVQGASTITQQLARNLFLTHEKSITRKAKEIIIAMRLEKLFPKDKILELYLNT
ncbi:MAG: transglycosylase domain-containing protein, partial [Synergistaceae bacterium]|nr:transglycosylase domain-containing protein [Synergistaceae bacterium]